jgi:hypothetical protein
MSRSGWLPVLLLLLVSAAACRATSTRERSVPALLVHNALRGDVTVVEDPAGNPRFTVLPCAQLGRWAVYAGERDGQLVALDTERRQLAALDLGKLRGARCPFAEELAVRRVPLHGGAVPYRGRFVGDRLFVSFFSENRIEVYRWPDLSWERDIRFEASENLGLSDMDTDGSTLLVTATGYVCFERHCRGGRFRGSHLYFIDTRTAMTPPFPEAVPANLNTLSVLANPPYLVSAGDLEGGYGSLQRIKDDHTLGAPIRLPTAAGPETAHYLGDDVLLVHQMAGEHLFLIDTRTDTLRAILRFDGHAFLTVPLDTKALPERSAAELQDVAIDPHDRGRLFLVDMKGDRLVVARHTPGDWTLTVERVDSLATESFRAATQWTSWLP